MDLSKPHGCGPLFYFLGLFLGLWEETGVDVVMLSQSEDAVDLLFQWRCQQKNIHISSDQVSVKNLNLMWVYRFP